MADLKGTKTEANLAAAFAGESQAHAKYQYFASKAKKEGYVQIHDIFMETSKNEKEHAKIWFKLLHDGEVPDTIANLNAAADGENEEWTAMYKEFAETAQEKKVSMKSQVYSPWLVTSKKNTKKDTELYSLMLKAKAYSKKKKKLNGNVLTVAT